MGNCNLKGRLVKLYLGSNKNNLNGARAGFRCCVRQRMLTGAELVFHYMLEALRL